jgi:hypothetical protein
MSSSTDDAEMNDVFSLLAGESSDSARTEPMAVAIGQDFGEDEEIQKPNAKCFYLSSVLCLALVGVGTFL